MGQFISDAQLQAYLESVIKAVPGFCTGTFWSPIITASNTSAYLDIQSALIARGLTVAQVDTWDRGAEYEQEIGTYYCLYRAGATHRYEGEQVNKFDRRAELKTIALLSGGVPIRSLDTQPVDGVVYNGRQCPPESIERIFRRPCWGQRGYGGWDY